MLLDGGSLAESAAIVPPALRQVADTLAALRAAPSAAELRGETAIMAEFRVHVGYGARAGFRRFGRSVPAMQRRAVPRDALAAVNGSPYSGPFPVADGRDPFRHGHRARGRHGRPHASTRRRTLAVAAAVTTVAAAGVAVASFGNLHGPAQGATPVAFAARSAGTRTTTAQASPGVDAKSARAVPSPSHPESADSPPPSSVTPASAKPTLPASRASLCDAVITSLAHASPGQSWWTTPAYEEVSAAAGGPDRVPGYCAAEWAKIRPHDYPQAPVLPVSAKQSPGNQPLGNQVSGNQPAGSGTLSGAGNGTANPGGASQGAGWQGTQSRPKAG